MNSSKIEEVYYSNRNCWLLQVCEVQLIEIQIMPSKLIDSE